MSRPETFGMNLVGDVSGTITSERGTWNKLL